MFCSKLLSIADVPMFAVGLLFAFFSAWLCIRWLMRYISTHRFVSFACYRIVLGRVVLATDLERPGDLGGLTRQNGPKS